SRAMEAAQKAISSPLLENVSINGATGIIINITGPSDMTLFEVNEASKLVQQEAHEDANIIFGAVIDERMKDALRVTVIATGFNKEVKKSTYAPATTLPKYKNVHSAATHAAPPPPTPVVIRSQPAAPVESVPVAERREMPQADIRAKFFSREAAMHEDDGEKQYDLLKSRAGGEMSELKKLVAEIGVVDMSQDEYDIPTFLRKQAD
ncbi:MAG: hypothetical protein IT572_00265, partial [Deltaproteobacteria bacterium]|nr:hypothetical protein [Deltaproteobacteria bacterium]